MTRRFYRTTDVDDTNAWTIPKGQYNELLVIPRRTVFLPSVGADGAFDLHGDNRAPAAPGVARFSFIITAADYGALQTSLGSMIAGLQGATRDKGRRKLWRWEENNDSAAYWTYAKLAALPEFPKTVEQLTQNPVAVEMLLQEPVFYDAITTAKITALGLTPVTLNTSVVPEAIDPYLDFAEFTIAATPFTFTLTNAGNEHGRRIIFRFESQGVNGFTNPKIENLTTAQNFQSTTDGGNASTILSVDCSPGLGKAQKSVNSGTSWTDDTAALTLGGLQGVLMELAPGANSLRYTDGGTPNLKLRVWWLDAYRE